MNSQNRKAFKIKVGSLVRTLKQYKNYKNQVANFDMNLVGHDKKQTQFYQQSKAALDSVQSKLMDWTNTLQTFMNQNKQELNEEDNPDVLENLEKAKNSIKQVHQLFPAGGA